MGCGTAESRHRRTRMSLLRRWWPWMLAAAVGAVPADPALADEGNGLMTLIRTDRTMPDTGDPIWELQLAIPGQKLRRYRALVGKAGRQNADRHELGSRAPLPVGTYSVSEIEPMRPEDPWELGRFIWIGLEPTFTTNRKALGIHHDPSAGRGRRSGTLGCIGLIHGNDLLVLGDLIRRHGTRTLIVKD